MKLSLSGGVSFGAPDILNAHKITEHKMKLCCHTAPLLGCLLPVPSHISFRPILLHTKICIYTLEKYVGVKVHWMKKNR